MPISPAAITITGKGSCATKIATKAAPAMTQWAGRLSARRETLRSASITITRTAALMPVNTACTLGTCPKVT
jgi:hypothetical protein